MSVSYNLNLLEHNLLSGEWGSFAPSLVGFLGRGHGGVHLVIGGVGHPRCQEQSEKINISLIFDNTFTDGCFFI